MPKYFDAFLDARTAATCTNARNGDATVHFGVSQIRIPSPTLASKVKSGVYLSAWKSFLINDLPAFAQPRPDPAALGRAR